MSVTESTGKVMRLFRGSVVMTLALGIFTGCETLSVFKKQKESRWAVTFHLLAEERDGENLSVVRVNSLDNEDSYLIRRIALSGSKDIVKGELVKKDGKVVAVTFRIDPYRNLKWLAITTEYGGQKVAVCLNGYFRFLWRVPRHFNRNTGQITVDGPWDPREAELVCEWASTNYKNHD